VDNGKTYKFLLINDIMKLDMLKQIVENAQCDQEAFGMIQRHVTGTLIHLGVEPEKAESFMLNEIENKKIKDLAEWEDELHTKLGEMGVYKNLDQRMKERAKEWFRKIKQHLLKTTTLDLGGGSGEVAILMKEHGCEVTVADVLKWTKEDIPFVPVLNNKVDVEDGAYDQVVLLTVFHHADNFPELVSEAFRIAKKRVIFIESVTENLIGFDYGAWIDWFYNRVIHYSKNPSKKINVPCNFLPATGWEQLIWKLTGLNPTISKNVGIYQHLNPENHHLLVYDKK